MFSQNCMTKIQNINSSLLKALFGVWKKVKHGPKMKLGGDEALFKLR